MATRANSLPVLMTLLSSPPADFVKARRDAHRPGYHEIRLGFRARARRHPRNRNRNRNEGKRIEHEDEDEEDYETSLVISQTPAEILPASSCHGRPWTGLGGVLAIGLVTAAETVSGDERLCKHRAVQPARGFAGVRFLDEIGDAIENSCGLINIVDYFL